MPKKTRSTAKFYSRTEVIRAKEPALSMSRSGLELRIELSLLRSRIRYYNSAMGRVNESEDHTFVALEFNPLKLFRKPSIEDLYYDGHSFNGVSVLGVTLRKGHTHYHDHLIDRQQEFAHLIPKAA
ncbi:hypothetical protein CL689_02915 [Candidatus Saccharibacteria bacterium]|nr:hypothetical protein [Candidatus Saccharibacteria bacterium]